MFDPEKIKRTDVIYSEIEIPEDYDSNKSVGKTDLDKIIKSKYYFDMYINTKDTMFAGNVDSMFVYFLSDKLGLNQMFWLYVAYKTPSNAQLIREIAKFGYAVNAVNNSFIPKKTLMEKLVKKLGLDNPSDTKTIITEANMAKTIAFVEKNLQTFEITFYTKKDKKSTTIDVLKQAFKEFGYKLVKERDSNRHLSDNYKIAISKKECPPMSFYDLFNGIREPKKQEIRICTNW